MISRASPGRPGRSLWRNPTAGSRPTDFQGGTDVVHGQGIHERKERVDVVQGWPPVPLLKCEVLLLSGDEFVEHAEIHVGGIAFDPAQSIEVRLPAEPLQVVESSWKTLL